MPSNVFMDIDLNNGPLSGNMDEQRALQLALDMSILGLGPEHDECPQSQMSPRSLSPNSDINSLHFTQMTLEEHIRAKKSANMTECVPVPSSEHVAEIVGRQGCKIKALRAKTNTYIKTPVRGEEPVFVVTGRKEDVCLAKQEILSAAEHFSQIRASRRNNSAASPLTHGPPSPTTPGQVTIQVTVPYKVVGLVVGPKGATIKRIQQQTHTYIVTPSREREPVFEVTGAEDNVEKARQEIESHIAMRTGGMCDPSSFMNPGDMDSMHFHNQVNDFQSNGIDSCLQDISPELLSFYKPQSNNSLQSNNSAFSTYRGGPTSQQTEPSVFNFPPNHKDLTGFNPTCLPTFEDDPLFNESLPVWSDQGSFAAISGLFSYQQPPPLHRASSLSTPRLSPTLTESDSSRSASSTSAGDHPALQRLCSDPTGLSMGQSLAHGLLASLMPQGHPDLQEEVFPSVSGSCSSHSVSPTNSSSPGVRRHCLVCMDSEVVAALVPCGHNLFCMECASLIVEKSQYGGRCPVCALPPSQAIRIFS